MDLQIAAGERSLRGRDRAVDRALGSAEDGSLVSGGNVVVYRNLSSFQSLRGVRWAILLEQPEDEAYALARATTRDTLRVALAGLPPRQRDVVTCRYLAGLSEQETAQVLGLARGTVKSRAARGLARLRADLDDRAVGPDRRGEGDDG